MKDLIEKCWEKDPKARPTFQKIYANLSEDCSYLKERIDENEIDNFIKMTNNNELVKTDIDYASKIIKESLPQINKMKKILLSAIKSGNIKLVSYLLSHKTIDIN